MCLRDKQQLCCRLALRKKVKMKINIEEGTANLVTLEKRFSNLVHTLCFSRGPPTGPQWNCSVVLQESIWVSRGFFPPCVS